MTPNELVASAPPAEVDVKNTENEPEDTWWKSDDSGLSVSGSIAVYRGEGNANVVLAVPSERKVIRFRKSSSPNKETVSSDGGLSRTTREVDFHKYVISGFLGDYIQPPEALRVTREEMIRINEAVRPVRPEYRLSKEIVEEYATVFTDYAFLRKETSAAMRRPTFCVEIKPKSGFRLPNNEQYGKCTYCLTQYHKLKLRAISSRSRYCPFDLFSGSQERVKKSLRALLDSPQNNLKIFKNGVVVYDHKSEADTAEIILAEWFGPTRTHGENFDAFFRLVSEALFREFSTDFKAVSSEEPTPQCLENRARIDPNVVEKAKRILSHYEECDFSGDKIPEGSVLGRILGMQRLPYHSADTVYRIYSKHSGMLNDGSFYSKMIEMCGGTRSKVSVKIKEENDKNGNDNRKAENDSLRNNNNRLREDDIDLNEFEILKNYLLSTMAKDCSVLMAFQEIDETYITEIDDRFIAQSQDGVKFVVNVGVLDLDPKSLHCIEKHRLRDNDVLLSTIDLLEGNDSNSIS